MNIFRFKKNIAQLSDNELLEKYRSEREQKYIGELFSRYYELTYLVCLKYLKDTDTAKDATMDIFEKLFDTLLNTSVGNFKNWLYSVAKNHSLMVLRKQNITVDITEIDFSEKSFMENDVKFDLLSENEKNSVNLKEKLAKLKEPQRKCLTMFYFEKKSYKVIANETSYSIKQVKSYIQNGKRNLKNLLENKSKED